MRNSFPRGTSHNPTVDYQKAEVLRGERPLTRRLGMIAAATAIAASLSVALTLASQATPQLDGQGVVTQANAQLPNSGGNSVTFIVTKGQKG